VSAIFLLLYLLILELVRKQGFLAYNFVTEYPIVIILVQDELVAEQLSFVGNVEEKCCQPQTFEEDREVQTVVTGWLTTGQDIEKRVSRCSK